MRTSDFKVGASVVLYNTDEHQLTRLLNSIYNSKAIDTIYLVDNSPSSISLNLKYFPSIKYIKNNKNIGYGAGHNIAIRESIKFNDFHFVLNPDIYFESSEIEKMLIRISSDISIGQLMPKVLYPNGDIQYLCKLVPSPFDLIFRRFMIGPLRCLVQDRISNFELRHSGYSKEMNVPYLSGCFMLFRSSALREVGLFDERFFMYPEDIDMTRRMHKKFKTLFFPEALVFHDHAKESYKSYGMLKIHVVNIIKYFNKWGWFFDSERVNFNKSVLESLKEY